MNIPKTWNPGEREPAIYEQWVRNGYFTANPDSGKPAFSMVMPPPNVNGNLHIGHAFGHVITDVICRYKRAHGFDVLWLPGTDHAGIATQIAVEKKLAEKGVSRTSLGREEFFAECLAYKDSVQENILGQMRRLGDSADWSRLRFTLDEQLSVAVRTLFKQLYDAGLIYRAQRLVNWSPILQTAVSDLEVIHKEVDGELISFQYGDIVVATTRLETILGDTAIAVHPDDERYQHRIGTSVPHPFQDRQIPIIADTYVDPEFGTGAVKITPAHDPNDYEVGLRHKLEMPTIMDTAGRIVNTGTEFDGLDRHAARRAIGDALRTRGLIVHEVRPYRHSVAHSERSGEPVEPRLSLQWWVNVAELAKASAQAVHHGDTVLHPESQNARWFDWVDNMHDWCISRQLWWGHRIPVWYGPDGDILVPEVGEHIPEGYVQDEDVLDTWFSSGLFPFSTMGWPHDTPDLERYYPTTLLATGYDIIFFWVARMMMFAQFIKLGSPSVPFKEVLFHGLVRDAQGRKMSKSKGNGVDPMDMLERYGVDALRFALARGANPGVDHNIGDELVLLARNFVTKIFNAVKFALINGATVGEIPAREDLTLADRWILSRLKTTIEAVNEDCATYNFGKATDTLYHFAWDDFCDWYLELAKSQLKLSPETTRAVLGAVCERLLILLHPFIPFVTEVLWQELTGRETLNGFPWPKASDLPADQAAERAVEDMQKIITEIRRFRNDQGIKPSRSLTARLAHWDDYSSDAHNYIIELAKIEQPNEQFNPSAHSEVSVTSGIERIDYDVTGAIDVEAERAKLTKELNQARKDLESSEVKLANAAFLAKAPQEVVTTIQARHTQATADVARITERLAAL